jgi:hypothetical protein
MLLEILLFGSGKTMGSYDIRRRFDDNFAFTVGLVDTIILLIKIKNKDTNANNSLYLNGFCP